MEPDLPVRALAAIRAAPGSPSTTLARVLRTSPARALEAVARLEEEGLAFALRIARRVFLFPGPAPPGTERAVLAVLVRATTRAVARDLLAADHGDVTALAQRLGLPLRTAYAHAEALVDAGAAVTMRGPAGTRILYPNALLGRALERFDPAPFVPSVTSQPSYPP